MRAVRVKRSIIWLMKRCKSDLVSRKGTTRGAGWSKMDVRTRRKWKKSIARVSRRRTRLNHECSSTVKTILRNSSPRRIPCNSIWVRIVSSFSIDSSDANSTWTSRSRNSRSRRSCCNLASLRLSRILTRTVISAYRRRIITITTWLRCIWVLLQCLPRWLLRNGTVMARQSMNFKRKKVKSMQEHSMKSTNKICKKFNDCPPWIIYFKGILHVFLINITSKSKRDKNHPAFFWF